MKLKRILLVMTVPPLPFGSAAGRWYYVLLKGLIARGHQVTAFVVCSHSDETKQVRFLFPTPEYDIRCYYPELLSGLKSKFQSVRYPYSFLFSAQFRADLEQHLAEPFDVLHLEQHWSAWLGLQHPTRSLLSVHYLFSEDRTFQVPNSLENRLRRWVSYGAERRILKSFPQLMTLSDRLSRCITQVNPQASTTIIPLGIDLSLYPFPEQQQQNPYPTVGIIGSFNWTPTYSAAERLLTRLWAEIKRQVPEARLKLVGRSAKTALAAFAHLPDVEFHQDVPDILPYFSQMDVMLYAPSAGSGMKVKVMEAFAMGTPVVTTDEGVEGLPAQDGIHADICSNDAELIDRTVTLLQQPQQRQSKRIQARKLLEEYCSPQVTVAQVEKLYQTISG